MTTQIYRRTFAVLLGSLVALSLSGCGEKICVAGFGDCSVRGNNAEPTTNSRMTIHASTSDMKAGERREITVTGGVGPNITLTITQGMGNFEGQIVNGRAMYVAPTNPAASGTSVVITARDSAFVNEAQDPNHYHWASVHFMVYP